MCHGFRKNPKDKKVGQYAYKHGVKEKEKKKLNAQINTLVTSVENRGFDELKAANLHSCVGCNAFVAAKIKYDLPSINDEGVATQLALARCYSSQLHTDPDFFLTHLSCYDKEAKEDVVLYHFCFPTYGIAVPMKSGDIILFNPTMPHCATNPRTVTALIYSMYVSNKTCNTVVANTMD